MTQEEKARAYDEVREKIAIRFGSNVAEEIFSQFEMSEDERIRKDIISFVEQAIDAGYGIISKERKEKWIAWLEKQGRLMKALQISNARIGELIEKNYYLKEQLEKQGKTSMGISEAAKQKLEDNLHEALEKETPESCNEFLDEQGEQKSMKTCAEYYNQDDELKMPELSEFQNKLADILMYREYDGPDETEDDIARGRLEYELAAIRLSEELLPLAQKEQKPADMVEPEFEIGDLITNGILVGKIDEIHGLGYHAYFGDHYADVPDIENWHKWTIQDAKDGDVIYSRHNTESFEWIGIFKSLDKENKRVFFYGFWNNIAKSFSVCRNEAYVLYDDFSPATKGQCDLLSSKMKEVGYEWDAEKKELKKIEEEEYNGEDYGIDSLYHAQRILEKTLGKVDGYQSDDGILEHKCAINAVKELSKQKPADTEKGAKGNDREIPNSAWSEEDENRINRLINYFEDKESFTAEDDIVYANWLKSLKDRHTWKPSDEQMRELSIAVTGKCWFSKEILSELLEQLKKLRDK